MQQVVVDAIGARVAIDLTGLPPGDRSTVAALWADASVGLARSGGTLVSVELGTAFEFSSVLADLSTRVTVAALGARRGEVWMLHACGVADERGRVAVLIGPSGAGKTTAAISLGARFGYVSDESIGITASGGVLAYRKPLSIVRSATASKEQVSPSTLGLKPLPAAPLTLGALILLDRRRDRADAGREPQRTAVPESVAVAAMAEQSSYLTSMVRPLQTVRTHLRRTGGAHRISYDDAGDLPEMVAAILDAGDDEQRRELPDDPTGMFAQASSFAAEALEGEPQYSRAPHVDSTTLEAGHVAVLRSMADAPAEVIVLAPHAGAVWRALSTPAALRDQTLQRVADELVEHGLLRRE